MSSLLNKKNTASLLFLSLLTYATPQKLKIGLLVVATGKYTRFVEPLLKSADTYFCPDEEVHYFIFTDSHITPHKNTHILEHKRLGWPYDTMLRVDVYRKYKKTLKDMDYLFATDADMLFVDTVGNEILDERVATEHPGFVGRRGSYETRQASTAYISENEGKQYYAGGFYGGSTNEFLKMADAMSENIKTDLHKGIIAVWHDESHVNRYFATHEPTKVLDSSYCYPESWDLPYPKRLLALDKNHDELRSEQ